ncbi:MAG: efflux RND transporter periplasmic adaptor subunit [Aphanothece sp. CMT-3BRIN-NPC111]|jgi:HlyD family secretion protein|nr:efflux RND transporter periplasmic adaptor subunit [Aphanothece sp. CMT-3BRIN-NPC111]
MPASSKKGEERESSEVGWERQDFLAQDSNLEPKDSLFPHSADNTASPHPQIGKIKRRPKWVLSLIAVGLAIASTGTYFIVSRSSPKIDIDKLTVPVKSETLTVRIAASGTVVPFQSVNLSPKNAGRLAKLFVKQGDRVQQGQQIALMENAELQAQFFQAKANLDQAEARLAEGQTSRPEEIDQAKARLAQAEAGLAQVQNGSRPEEIAQAQARLNQAAAGLAQVQAARPKEIEQAQAQVNAAIARANLAKKRLSRYQNLRQQGAIAADKLDEVEAESSTAQANREEAERRLDQIRSSKPQEVAKQEAAVAEAQASLRQIQSGSRSEEIAQRAAEVAQARSALQQAQNGKRPEEIAQFKAAVEAARASMQAVQVQLQDTAIRAPFEGIVTQKYADVGAFVTPTTSASSTASATSTAIVAIAKDLEIKAKVPEVDIGQIQVEQPVEIVADAYPDKIFKGRVALVSPEAVVEQNVTSFEVRVAIDTEKEQLRSGMNVNLTFLGEQVKDALVIPTVAIVTEQGKTGVLLPDTKNEPKFQPVTLGPSIQNQTQILDGVKKGDRVFVEPPKGWKPDQPEDKDK